MHLPPALFWFRRDLRLTDNPALVAAAEGRPVVGLFVIDDALYGPSGDNRRAFLRRCLDALDAAMGGTLVVRWGDPAEIVPEVAAEVCAGQVYATGDHGPYGTARDERVAAALATSGRSFIAVDSPYAVPPGSVATGSGTPFKVFTPYYRAWQTVPAVAPVPAPDVEWVTGLASDELPPEPDVTAELPGAGEAAADADLNAFLAERVDGYDDQRDRPGIDGTSRLSAHLKWGTIHPRQVLARLDSSVGQESFRRQVAWRDFYGTVLNAWPDSARHNFVPKMDALTWDTGPEADERFAAWCDGRTGYPIVDAGMRQLRATGWMHNRVRMITASFLVKDLHLDWRRGARWFMDQLVDGDLAANQHGWQWTAGTGTDASPFFRVFNPVSQGRKFDPDGAYVRRWVPEIAHLGDKQLHEPWTDPHGAPAGYPPPLVDHGTERLEALARYDVVKATASGATAAAR